MAESRSAARTVRVGAYPVRVRDSDKDAQGSAGPRAATADPSPGLSQAVDLACSPAPASPALVQRV